MPIETILVVASITFAFAIFASVLAWALHA